MGDDSEHARVLAMVEAVRLDGRGAEWLAEHRADVLAAARACDRDGARQWGIRLVTETWPAARLAPDPEWWADLAEVGEALAIADRAPGTLFDLLCQAAETFAGSGDQVRAEERWVRALAIARRTTHDQDRVLSALGALYREWGRLGKALDAYLALVDLRRSTGDAAGTALALADVGTTMYAAGRVESAGDYLDQADQAMRETDVEPGEHARVLVLSGWTRWVRGDRGTARRRWSRALALLVDVDEAEADRVRALLAADEPDFPYPSNTLSSSEDIG